MEHRPTSIDTRRLAACVGFLCCVAVVLVVGCGESRQEPDGPTVALRATSEFGHAVVASQDEAPLAGHRTVLRLVREHADLTTVQDGARIESIDERYYQELPFRTTWSLIVNGIEADETADAYRLFPGDVVQLDLRYWDLELDVRATVGAFPATFRRGVFGSRFPVTVRCVEAPASACRRVKSTLRAAGVAPDGSRPPGDRPPAGQPQRAQILVGEWTSLRDRPWPSRVDDGPGASGVFARFTPNGEALALLDWEGEPVRSVASGAGLVAAMRPTEEDLLWMVTGVDAEGVERAARALDAERLEDAFAVVVTDDVEKIPLKP